jgi:hypothetical protein
MEVSLSSRYDVPLNERLEPSHVPRKSAMWMTCNPRIVTEASDSSDKAGGLHVWSKSEYVVTIPACFPFFFLYTSSRRTLLAYD